LQRVLGIFTCVFCDMADKSRTWNETITFKDPQLLDLN
jgi:hypothetical protein